MKPTDKIGRIVSILVFGSLLIYKIYESFEEDFIFDILIVGMIAVIGIIIFIRNIRKDFKEYVVSKKKLSYLPTITGLIFLVTIIILCSYQSIRMNSPTLVRAFNDGGYNGFTMDFKKNGNYIFANFGGLGQNYFYGTYTIKDSVIILDRSEIDNVIQTNKLMIRNYSRTNNSSEKYIIQLDSKGNEIVKYIPFLIREDNR